MISMFPSLHTSRVCYGLDLSDRQAIVVKSSRTRKGVVHQVLLNECGAAALPAGLKEALDADIAAGRAVTAAAMPALESFTRWLQTPLKSMSKAQRVLPSLLDIQLPFPLESCQYRFSAYRRTPGGQIDALAVAAPEQRIQARLEACRRAGTDPLALDHEGLALWTQSLSEIPLERNAARIVVYVGLDRTVLILGRGADYLSAHALRIGSEALFPDGERAQGNAVQQWGQRVRQTLRAIPPEVRALDRQWLWTGPGAAHADLLAELQSILQEPAAIRHAAHRQPATFLARALGERQLARTGLPCNLRGGAAAHPGLSVRNAQTRRRALAALIAGGLLLGGLNLGWLGWLQAVSQNRQDQLSRLAARLAGMPRVPRGQELMIVRRALADNNKLQSPFIRAFRPSLFADAQSVLRLAHAQEARLSHFGIADDRIDLRGTAPDWEHGERIARGLENDGYSVTLERQDAGADERVPFAIAGRRAP